MRVNVNALIVREEKLLLIKFSDENGIHYNLPGGGMDEGESVHKALERECREEACAEVNVGKLAGAWEYVPKKSGFKFGAKQKVGLLFFCELKKGCEPAMPAKPDTNQIGVEWVPVVELSDLGQTRRHPIFPQIGQYLVEAIEGKPCFFLRANALKRIVP